VKTKPKEYKLVGFLQEGRAKAFLVINPQAAAGKRG